VVKTAQEVNDVGGARKIEKSKSMREIIKRGKPPLIDLQLLCDLVEMRLMKEHKRKAKHAMRDDEEPLVETFPT